MTLFLLDLALERSKDSPLTVTLNLSTVRANRLAVRIISAVVAHCRRWKTAELQISNALIPHFAPIRNHLPLLSDLIVQNFGDFPMPFPYAQVAPRLAHVTLNGFPHENSPLPWDSIGRTFSETVFPMEVRAMEIYLKILKNNPQLESLDVTYPDAGKRSKSNLTHFSLRRLFTDDGNLIRALTLPKLEELVVGPENDTMPAIRDMLTRSKCSPRSLRLIDFTLDKDLRTILSSSANLRTLVLRFIGWGAEDEKTMELLVKMLAEPSFLPRLEDLEILIDQERDEEPLDGPFRIMFINDAFVQMLAARWERRRPAERQGDLRRVCVLAELPSTVGLSKSRGVGGLQKMSDEGLDVIVLARDPRASDLSQAAKNISYVYM
ncbi:hypothetical protein DFH07DRAFT_436638 [Mycena maculata]|uniref:Uncharacterized protein n=1 Tax=Mycena maculata TaxID=230809 RepID=A0AAD7KAM2_9AGAR|nr:hypothetical protein DFH07DRAFT_436638 [Mycena maculata]